jgi:hypothetical protein
MANNVQLSAGTADGAVIATDDIGAVHYQYTKIGIGADDTFTILVGGAGAVAAGVQRVTLASDDPAVVDLAALEVLLTTQAGYLDGIETLIGTTNTNTGNAATSLSVLDDWDNTASDGASVSGDVAHDAVDAGEPVKIGGYAKAAAPTDVSADGDRVNAWFDLAGRLQVGDGGGSLTVDGTVAVTNAGITTIAGAVSGTEMQVDVLTSALPTGAATAAKQPALGTAGTASSDVITVQGIASMTALVVDGSGVTQPVSHAALTELAAAINASSQVDVNLAASNATVTVDLGVNNDVTVTGTVDLGATDNAVLDAIAASVAAIDTDATTIIGHVDGIEALLGTMDADTGSILTAVQLIDNPIVADDAAFSPATTSVNMAGFFADEGSTDSIDEGDGGAARMTLDRKQIVTPYVHAAAGGASGYNNTDVQETDVQIKGSAGKIFSIYAWNMTAGPLWLKLHNALAASVTPGTTAPTYDLMVPANADSDGAGFVIPLPPMGLQFSTGITIYGSATRGTTAADVGSAGNLGVFITYA